MPYDSLDEATVLIYDSEDSRDCVIVTRKKEDGMRGTWQNKRMETRSHRSLFMTLLVALGVLVGLADRAAWGETDLSYIEAPPDGKAVVLVFRPPRRGKTGWVHLYCDGEIAGAFGYSSYLRHVVDPGTHRYMVVGEAADFLDVEAKAGHVYFAEVYPRVGAWRARFSLVPYEPSHPRLASLKKWLDRSKEIIPGEKEQTWHARNASSVERKRAAYLPKWEARTPRPTLSVGYEPTAK